MLEHCLSPMDTSQLSLTRVASAGFTFWPWCPSCLNLCRICCWTQLSPSCLHPILHHHFGNYPSPTTRPTETLVPAYQIRTWSTSHSHPWHLLNKCYAAQLDRPPTYPDIAFPLSSYFHLGDGCVPLLAWIVLYSTYTGECILWNTFFVISTLLDGRVGFIP